ncbi:NAD(P)/FAD-dependent oxidoreductase [Synechococcus elongatus PCC 11801]|uniref:NAD(P)/FAD-dependent oxidoreductase n=2 Tax=Synechococcus elongatus TaxID=32046 RepID=A0AAN1QM91_SYNEL|nr:NAD(P)/FAD-dependent oxidoreductase [Synechococcus elongatus]
MLQATISAAAIAHTTEISLLAPMISTVSKPRVVVIGGGFGGLYTALNLGKAPVELTLIDKRNFHLFQPLLYQVATGEISPGDIAAPLRAIVGRNPNTRVILGEVTDIDPQAHWVRVGDEIVEYDYLVVATGASHHYFGNDQWQPFAPGLKTVEDALEMRRRIYFALEQAEQESDPERQKAWLTFTIVGAGPTGVELAGAIAELTRGEMRKEFRNVDTTQAKVILIEGMDRVLPPFPPELSAQAQAQLEGLGVIVQTKAMVTDIQEDRVVFKTGDELHKIPSRTTLWAAGVKASPLGKLLAQRTGAELDRIGRVIVQPDLQLPTDPSVYVLGDLAHCPDQNGNPLPGVAAVAMQQGAYLGKALKRRVQSQAVESFRYQDFGSMAVIGRNAAVARLGGIRLSGLPAWLVWAFVHVWYLIEFDSKLLVMVQWAWTYFNQKRGTRLIVNHHRMSAPAATAATTPEKELAKS